MGKCSGKGIGNISECNKLILKIHLKSEAYEDQFAFIFRFISRLDYGHIAFFDIGADHNYYDEYQNRHIIPLGLPKNVIYQQIRFCLI